MQAGTSKRVQEVFSPTEERLGEASTANDENVAGEVEGSVGQHADSIASSRLSIREKKLRRATKKVINANRLSRRESKHVETKSLELTSVEVEEKSKGTSDCNELPSFNIADVEKFYSNKYGGGLT